MRRKDVVWTILIVVLATLAVQGFAQRRDTMYKQFETLATVVEKIRENYVEEVNEEEILEGAIRGALMNLDRYSAYIPPADLEEFRTETKGEFQGLGIEIGIRQNWLTVIAPIEGTPAWRSGIRAGDQIRKIEGKSTAGMTTMDAVKKLRGAKNTSVTITIRHEGEHKDVDLTITRDVIPLISIRGYKRTDGEGHWDYFIDKANGIGYLRMSAFRENTVDELDKAVAEMRGQGMKGLILDLRFNPGGLLSTAVRVSDRFISDGVIVSTRGRAVKPVSYDARRAGTYEPFALVVLVNSWSASASEIVAGAVQDHHRAILVGERTFGKGSVQNVILLNGGKAALKLTTAHYYTPSGRNINRNEDTENGKGGGLIPDIVVETTPEDQINIQRLWLKLSTPPKPEDGKPEAEKTEGEKPELEKPEVEKPEVEKPAVPPGETPTDADLDKFEDRQLNRAVDAIRVLIWQANPKLAPVKADEAA